MVKKKQKMVALNELTHQKLEKLKDELQAEKEYSSYSFDQCITDLMIFYKANMENGSFSPTVSDVLETD